MSIASRADIDRLAAEIERAFGDRVDRVLLYGSYARGEELPGSDVDVAILVTDERPDDRERAFDVAREFILDEELRFSPRVFGIEEFERKAEQGYSFYRAVPDEGVEV